MTSYKDAVTQTEHLTGRVKWFNKKTGYGFITVTSGERSGTDVFVHYSAISVDNQQYKYLVQREYVEFDLAGAESDKHEYQAKNVTVVRRWKTDKGENERALKNEKNEHKTKDEQTTTPKQKRPFKSRKEQTVKKDVDDNKEWTIVGQEKVKQSQKKRKHKM